MTMPTAIRAGKTANTFMQEPRMSTSSYMDYGDRGISNSNIHVVPYWVHAVIAPTNKCYVWVFVLGTRCSMQVVVRERRSRVDFYDGSISSQSSHYVYCQCSLVGKVKERKDQLGILNEGYF
jgi:hypothetical protein